ncbi:hypothetical protein FHS36_003376 [Streptomyces eurocidicus]|uniref:Uncharacterized protein n=1 Tax=Streptomyces eurocidicus TaxID=66423 RepID=A0A7W8F2U6_STREU|nr:hypothetical protein [Streptomyces eurocidicus]
MPQEAGAAEGARGTATPPARNTYIFVIATGSGSNTGRGTARDLPGDPGPGSVPARARAGADPAEWPVRPGPGELMEKRRS